MCLSAVDAFAVYAGLQYSRRVLAAAHQLANLAIAALIQPPPCRQPLPSTSSRIHLPTLVSGVAFKLA